MEAVPYRVWLEACGRTRGRESVRAWRREMGPVAVAARERVLVASALVLPALEGGGAQVAEAERIRRERIGAAVRVLPAHRAPTGLWWCLREPGQGSPVIDPLRIDPWLPTEYPGEREAVNTLTAQLGRPECVDAGWWVGRRARWEGFPDWESLLQARDVEILPYPHWLARCERTDTGQARQAWEEQVHAGGAMAKRRILTTAARSLPPLEGTADQVRWAQDLRRDRMSRAVHVQAHVRAPGGARWYLGGGEGADPLLVGSAAAEALPDEQACLRAVRRALEAPERREAAWWIDTRGAW